VDIAFKKEKMKKENPAADNGAGGTVGFHIKVISIT
jgi:hypothetical protein